MTAFVIPNAIQITTRQAKYTFASFLSRDTTFDVIFNIWRLARPEDSLSRESLEGGSAGASVRSVEQVGVGVGVGAGGGAGGTNGKVVPMRKVTACACGKEGKHYSETALETVLPGTPDRIHNLIFASGFIKDFMRVDQKLMGESLPPFLPASVY
jgi:hypothetical protein